MKDKKEKEEKVDKIKENFNNDIDISLKPKYRYYFIFLMPLSDGSFKYLCKKRFNLKNPKKSYRGKNLSYKIGEATITKPKRSYYLINYVNGQQLFFKGTKNEIDANFIDKSVNKSWLTEIMNRTSGFKIFKNVWIALGVGIALGIFTGVLLGSLLTLMGVITIV